MAIKSFSELINTSGIPVLVEFFAEWCGPCKTMNLVLQQIAEEFNGKLKVIKIDVDKNHIVGQHFQLQSVPTLILFYQGEVLWRQSGVISTNQLSKIIKECLSKKDLLRSSSQKMSNLTSTERNPNPERFKLDTLYPNPLISNFKSSLSYSEKQEIELYEAFNVYRLQSTYIKAITEYPTNFHQLNYEVKHAFLDSEKEAKIAEDEKAALRIVSMASLNLRLSTKGELKFVGKLPKSGLFCSRQAIADSWLDQYNAYLTNGVKKVYNKSGGNKSEASSYILANGIYYLANSQPEKFKIDLTSTSSLNEQLYRLNNQLLEMIKGIHSLAN